MVLVNFNPFLLLIILFIVQPITCQSDSVYTNIEHAIENPENIKELILSDLDTN